MNDYRLKLSIILLLVVGSLRLMAQGQEQRELPEVQGMMSCDDTLQGQEADSASCRPSFGLDYSGEVQTDLKRVRVVNLLELHADVPLSRKLSFQLASLSTYSSDDRPLADDVHGYSNLDADDIPFALTVAGFTWQFKEHHSLFAGIRRMDEDYFCSDGLAFFTNSSCGIFPTLSCNFNIATFPEAAWGIHYAYDNEKLCLQASLYNGAGNHRFTGRDNVFRLCPKSDGIYALGQAEYRYRGSRYFLGASMHTEPDVRPTVWTHAEQALLPNLTLLAAYGHAFGRNNVCNDFCGMGAIYNLKSTGFGVFTDYARIDGIDEWATEFICNLPLTSYLSINPVLHIITTDGTTKCVGLLRVNISI